MGDAGTRWRWVIAVGVMAMAIPAVAVAGGGDCPGKAAQATSGDQGAAKDTSAKAPMTGAVQGLVQAIDRPAGTVTLVNQTERIIVRGTPTQLLAITRGQNVSLPFVNYGGVYWL